MPILPPLVIQAYDSVNLAITSAQARLNGEITTLLPVSGKLLDNNQDSTCQSTNSAWRAMQDALADRGYAALLNEVVIAEIPVVSGLDPAIQTWLSWSGYFDGANFFPDIQLPEDFTHPIKIWERWSGQNAAFLDPPMEKILDGMPAGPKIASMRFWEWRGDAIWTPGSQRVEDLRIRYVKYLADFADTDTRWYTKPIPIMRGSNALSWFLCAEVVGARGERDLAETLREKGLAALAHLFNLDVKADQRVNIQRRPHGRGRFY